MAVNQLLHFISIHTDGKQHLGFVTTSFFLVDGYAYNRSFCEFISMVTVNIFSPVNKNVGLDLGHILLHGDPAPPKGRSPEFSAHVCCGQTVGWINMRLGMEVGLGPGKLCNMCYVMFTSLSSLPFPTATVSDYVSGMPSAR